MLEKYFVKVLFSLQLTNADLLSIDQTLIQAWSIKWSYTQSSSYMKHSSQPDSRP